MSAPYRLFSGRLNVTIISIFAASASICAVFKLFGLFNNLKKNNPKKSIKNRTDIKENGISNESKKAKASQEITLPAVNGVLDRQQILTLIEFLKTNSDEDVLQKVVTTIANACAFKHNQDLLRELNGLELIVNFLQSSFSLPLRISASLAISNLSVNSENNMILQECIPDLCTLMVSQDEKAESCHFASLQALTNLSLINPCSVYFHQSIQYLFDMLSLDDLKSRVNLQTLKVLVNLSCDDAMVESLLKAEPPAALLNYLQPPVEDDHALRVLTLFANVTKDVQIKERVEEWKCSRKNKQQPSTYVEEESNSNQVDNQVRSLRHKPLSMIQEEEEVEVVDQSTLVKPAVSLQSLDLIPDNTLYDMVHGNSSLSLRCYVMMLKLYDHEDIQQQANILWDNLY
ncbi:armadillo repeat-containing protein 10-like [Antedon mediterranea]|uniref:armadillo repeat-containing protein 10-like n=1 Tax=Antedon mediterranea TaxID=105859 RepID=UPI003AF9C9A7